MNNGKVTLDRFLEDENPDKTPWLKDREATLVRLVETLRRVEQSEDWSSLKKLLWDDVVETLERQQKSEAEKDKPDPMHLVNIRGQLIWARKFSDLAKLADVFSAELRNVRQQLK